MIKSLFMSASLITQFFYLYDVLPGMFHRFISVSRWIILQDEWPLRNLSFISQMLCDNRKFIQPLIRRRNKFMEVDGELLALKHGHMLASHQIVNVLFSF